MPASKLRPAMFLDRDGVINEDPGYVFKPEDLRLLPDVAAALRRLEQAQVWRIVISNQSGVARGFYSCADVDSFHRALKGELARHGASLDGIYYSPYHRDGSVAPYNVDHPSRKPGTQMIEQAQQDFVIDMARSVVVGDKASDIICASNAGISGIFIAPPEVAMPTLASAHVPNLAEAVEFYLANIFP